MDNHKKILFNILVALIASAVMTALVLLGRDGDWATWSTAFWMAGILFTMFFIMSTFYGDETFNITLNWNSTATKIKTIVGNVLAFILLTCGFILAGILIYILIDR